MDESACYGSDHSMGRAVSSQSTANSRAQKESVLQLPGDWTELVKVQIQLFYKPLTPINGFGFMNRLTACIIFFL